jgi:hypothetical protein
LLLGVCVDADKDLFSAQLFASRTGLFIFLEPISFTAAPIFASCSLSRRAGPQVFHSVLHLDAASRPSGLPLGSPSGCVGLGQGCLFFLLFKLEHTVQGPRQICLPVVAVFTYSLLLV